MGRHKITVLRSASGSACFFQNMHLRHNRTWQRSRKYCKTQHFCNCAIYKKKHTFLKSDVFGIRDMLFGRRLREEKQVKMGFCNLCYMDSQKGSPHCW